MTAPLNRDFTNPANRLELIGVKEWNHVSDGCGTYGQSGANPGCPPTSEEGYANVPGDPRPVLFVRTRICHPDGRVGMDFVEIVGHYMMPWAKDRGRGVTQTSLVMPVVEGARAAVEAAVRNTLSPTAYDGHVSFKAAHERY